MTIGMYDTADLVRVIEQGPELTSYWLDNFFPEEQLFDTEEIDFDIVDTDRRLAPFVAPSVAGRVMQDKGYTTRRFSPAYVKPKHVIQPHKTLKRRAGEPLTGNMSPAQRWMAAVADNLMREREMIRRRWEWMAAQAVIHDSVTVAGEDYPTQAITFGRSAGHTVAKSGGTYWGETDVSIIDDIEDWVRVVHESSGRIVTRITVAPAVWKVMANDAQVKDLLDTRRGSATSMELGPGDGSAAQFKGTLGASLQVWAYQDVYEDNSGTTQKMMPEDSIVLTSPGLRGIRCYGAILDRNALQAMSLFPKMYEQDDPSVVYTLTQSAPLMVPSVPDAALKAKVIA